MKRGAAVSESKRPLDAALFFLSPRPRTVREVERYLDQQNYGEYEIQQTVARLQEMNYLNDAEYAKEFVRTRLNTKPVSRAKLFAQLSQHELPGDIIQDALSSISPEDEERHALEVAVKFARQLADLAPELREARIIKRLTGRGFSYDAARRAALAAISGGNEHA